jgi:hypothetical protein
MAAPMPENDFERANTEERHKSRMDRQKLLCTLPRDKDESKFQAWLAERVVEAREEAEDGLLIAGAVADDALKARLLQNNRSVVAKLVKIQKATLVAAKEGMGFAQKLFVPDPTYDELDDDELKLMEKLRKEKAANKKKANIVPF